MINFIKYTFLEYYRDKILRYVFFFVFIIIFFSFLLGNLVLGEKNKIIVDFCLMLMEVSLVLVVLYHGAKIFFQEKKKKILDIVMLKNRNNFKYFCGKFLGLSLVFFVYWLFFVIFLNGYFIIFNYLPNNLLVYFVSYFAILIKILILNSLLMMFGILVRPFLVIIIGIVFYFLGHLTVLLKFYLSVNDYGYFMKIIINFLYYILPNFGKLNIKEYIFVPGYTLGIDFFLIDIWVGFSYIIVVLLISGLLVGSLSFRNFD